MLEKSRFKLEHSPHLESVVQSLREPHGEGKKKRQPRLKAHRHHSR